MLKEALLGNPRRLACLLRTTGLFVCAQNWTWLQLDGETAFPAGDDHNQEGEKGGSQSCALRRVTELHSTAGSQRT